MAETPEIRSEIEALEAEQEQINQAHQDAEEYPEDVDARMRIDELNDQAKQYREEEKRLAAVVSIESIHRGLVRSEDKRKVEAAKSGGNTENENGGDQGKESAEVQLSAALVEDLTSTPNRGLASSAREQRLVVSK
jgi:hypothetical protein